MPSRCHLPVAAALAAAMILAGSTHAVQFVNVAPELNLTERANTYTAAWADWDLDGDPDLLLVSTEGTTALWRNDGPAGFVNVTPGMGLPATTTGWSAAFGDFDEDGWPDLYLGNEGPNFLWLNNGDGTFRDATAEYGVENLPWSQGVQWVDYDSDGLLDLHITQEFDPFRMLRQAAPGVFVDVSEETGLDDPQSHGYGLSWGDIDGDGDLDCVISTCGLSESVPGEFTIDRLFVNQLAETGTATFVEMAADAGIAFQGNTYGNEIADVDNDGDWDIFVVGTPSALHKLYLNEGAFPFRDVAVEVGLGIQPSFTHGCEWVDYDNDGDVDLYVQHGTGRDYLFRNLLMETGELQFVDVSAQVGLLFNSGGYQGSWADYDGDGDLDLLSVSGRFPFLFENIGGNDNNWLFVNLDGVRDTRSGTGAVIRLETGDNRQSRIHGGQAGSFAQNWLPSHFGVGQSEYADELVVEWLTGGRTVVAGPVDVRRTVTVPQFDRVTTGWQVRLPADDAPVGMRGAASATGPSGETFVFGALEAMGGGGAGAALFIHDGVDWSRVDGGPAPRAGAAMAALDGLVYLYGGETVGATTPTLLADLEAWDPGPGTWNQVPAVGAPDPRRGADLLALDGRLLLLGGAGADGTPLDDAWAFDPAGGEWTAFGLPSGMAMGADTVAATRDGILYVLSADVAGRIHTYSAAGGWGIIDPGQGPLAQAGSASVAGPVAAGEDRWYVVGPDARAWSFDIAAGEWTAIDELLPSGIGGGTAALLDGPDGATVLHLYGGEIPTNDPGRTVVLETAVTRDVGLVAVTRGELEQLVLGIPVSPRAEPDVNADGVVDAADIISVPAGEGGGR